MLKLFRPAPVIDPLPKERVDKEYKKLRLQVFLGIFIGYAGYYLVRKNFSIAMPALEQMGFDKADLGWALSAVSIAYGISKFVMGTVSDHSNARVFIPLGLIASAVIMTYPVDGQFAFYHAYVLHLICKWLGARYGLASVWPGDGSLVFCPGTRRKDVYMEYRS